MRALTLASLLAVSMTGVACSERAPAEPEHVPAEASGPAAATETAEADTAQPAQFNLRYPGSDAPAGGQAGGGFNLRDPGSTAPAQGGFRLPEGALREDALSDIPEIRTPATDTQDSAAPQPEEDPDDDIIRLD